MRRALLSAIVLSCNNACAFVPQNMVRCCRPIASRQIAVVGHAEAAEGGSEVLREMQRIATELEQRLSNQMHEQSCNFTNQLHEQSCNFTNQLQDLGANFTHQLQQSNNNVTAEMQKHTRSIKQLCNQMRKSDISRGYLVQTHSNLPEQRWF
jgi:DNA anti-recombination protein RmuC